MAWKNDPTGKYKAQRLAEREYNREHYGTSYIAAELKRNYGCTLEEYRACMATSPECQICGSETNLCYDHCHDTGEFRGVLCRCCNQALGKLGDNEEGVQRALDYLRGN